MGKLVVITAPSGAGKTTIARHLLHQFPELYFSVSATTRAPRPHEQHGRDYFFISEKEFREKIAAGDFLEWEEVYPGVLYGSLRSEARSGWQQGKTILFDIDVRGARRLKEQFGDHALTVFVRPPSWQALEQRLLQRGTETIQQQQLRLERARNELQYEPFFDRVLVNDALPVALQQATDWVSDFLRPHHQP
ncbi:MAG: guanylate kinase [Chitinophagales bacterium]|nr:guanylate kinase [Chitinophagales bacterium]